MRILISGPAGSGKSTQSEILSKKLNIPVIDAGQMLRDLSLEDSEDGEQVRIAMETGNLVPDSVAGRVVKEKIEEEGAKGFILDGYPRELDQLKEYDPKPEKAFYLDIPDELAKERLLSRGRKDDTPEAIDQRLEIYHKKTEPVLEHYQDQGILYRINGTASIEEIAKEIEEKLNG